MESAAVSITGRREHNEDNFLVDDELGVYAVADGVGGHAAGEVASARALACVRDRVAAWRKGGKGSPTAVVTEAIEAACEAVFDEATSGAGRAGMATTLTMLLRDGSIGHMGHVGDSRLYLLRNSELHQLSTDHTFAAELFRGGMIPREQVDEHPRSHVLTRSCGSQASVLAEAIQVELHPDDVYLLSSDGLNPAVGAEPEAVVDALAPGEDLESGLEKIVRRAGELGSTDNITAVAWRCPAAAPAHQADTIALLRGVPLLTHLTLADLCRVADYLETVEIPKGEVVATRESRVDRLLIVVSGTLRWELVPGQYADLGPGDSIGATTLMRPRRCPAQLKAQSATVALELSSEAFRRLVHRRANLGVALLAGLADELSDWIDPDTDRGVAHPPQGLLVEF